MKPDQIDAIVIHCTATPEGKDLRAADIDKMHREEKGWKMIGYNYVIDLDGTVEVGRPLTMDGAHCKQAGHSGLSYNKHSIGICYVGGVEGTLNSKGQIVPKLGPNGKPISKDTRTPAQKEALSKLVYQLMDEYPIIEVIGHRDASPDLDGDGVINVYERIKDCPCFEVKAEFPMSYCTAKR
jgi:N-acetyl-anhydromuramyl-L-alanine amidase AmpD